ncbi:Radical SAM domain protein [Kribbella flavida DSM 17836]|uniref:Radical SAM domain protein n=1 Tax=Kribbella flavida (strain DSM 17836 / JCM 10339 / NBRC 14399) TaxID=479435 RepID=D2PWP4_KRIFD|nr:radical SAM protein [Kribbella flavida]ADB33513.1 Radical SAM domain protein [Kribbella flavida DSM 17836]
MLVTRSAGERAHTREVLARVEAAGVTDITLLRSDRISGLGGEDERAAYARAKATLAVVVSPPSARKLQPIAPSADWRLDLARGCPAHCQYCYLAGSLSGPPITRVYADLDDILAGMDAYVGRGTVTSTRTARAGEGTTYEASCYTDPLGIEPVTGSLAAAITHVGTHAFPGPVQLRATTKYGAVDGLLDLPHGGRTRIRASVNADSVAGRFEGGTDPVAVRLAGLGALARAGYPVGLTIAPIMPVEGWREQYTALLESAAAALPADADLTVECITHRFTPGSKEVLESWYPRTKLEMDPERRSRKFGKFGAVKYVYTAAEMRELRTWFDIALADHLPAARSLYWT